MSEAPCPLEKQGLLFCILLILSHNTTLLYMQEKEVPQALFNFGPSIKLHSYFIKLNPFLLRSRFYDGSLCRASELLVCSKRLSEVIELPKKMSQFVCFVLDFLPSVLCFDRNIFAEIGIYCRQPG